MVGYWDVEEYDIVSLSGCDMSPHTSFYDYLKTSYK